MNIVIQYFTDSNDERKKEYDECMRKNLNSPYVKSVHNIVEPGSVIPDEFLNHPKHIKQDIDISKTGAIKGRLTFQYAIEYARNTFKDGDIVALLNLDIYIPLNCVAWNTIKDDFFEVGSTQRVLCLTRHEADWNENLIKDSWSFREYCQDAWIFKMPIREIPDCNFCIGGCPGCDNAIMDRFCRAGYAVFNWATKYQIGHLDICREHVQKRYMVLNDKTDRSAPQTRGTFELSPYIQWETYLNSDTMHENQQKKYAQK